MEQFLSRLSLLPLIVGGIEQLHKDASSADKKTLALESLGLASAVAGQALPNQTAGVQAATTVASQAIDGLVAMFHAFGLFEHKAK